MKPIVLSQFKERPKLSITWWAMGLGLVTSVIVPLGIIFTVTTGPLSIENGKGVQSFALGWESVFLSLILLTVASIATAMISLHKGERSWALWLGFIPALIAASFWLLLLVGSLVFGI